MIAQRTRCVVRVRYEGATFRNSASSFSVTTIFGIVHLKCTLRHRCQAVKKKVHQKCISGTPCRCGRMCTRIAPVEWKKKAIELPPGWHEAVSARAKAIGGDRRGLTRYVWAYAAYTVLAMGLDELKAVAKVMREAHEEYGDALVADESTELKVAEIQQLQALLEGASQPRSEGRRRKERGRKKSTRPA